MILPVTVASRLSFLPSSATASSVVGVCFGLDGRGREPDPEAEVVALELQNDDPDRPLPPRVPNTSVEQVGVSAAGKRVAGDVFDLLRLRALELGALRLLPERASVFLVLDFLSRIVLASGSPVIRSQFSLSLFGRGATATPFPFAAHGISPVKDEKMEKTSFDGRGDVRDGGENVSARVSVQPMFVFVDGVTDAGVS